MRYPRFIFLTLASMLGCEKESSPSSNTTAPHDIDTVTVGGQYGRASYKPLSFAGIADNIYMSYSDPLNGWLYFRFDQSRVVGEWKFGFASGPSINRLSNPYSSPTFNRSQFLQATIQYPGHMWDSIGVRFAVGDIAIARRVANDSPLFAIILLSHSEISYPTPGVPNSYDSIVYRAKVAYMQY